MTTPPSTPSKTAQRRLQRKSKRKDKRAGESEFVCSLQFMNKLPELPYDPKFLKCPLEENRHYTYRETSLEREYKFELLTGIDVGVNLDLIDISSYAVPEKPPELDPIDQQLIEGASKSSTKQMTAPAAFLLHPQYLTNDNDRTIQSASSSSVGMKDKEDQGWEDDKQKQIQLINESFEAAKLPPKHPTNPKLRAEEILPLFPDEDLWGNDYSEVVFDTDPAGDEQIGNKRKLAILKSFVGLDSTGLKYFLPKRRRLEDEDEPEAEDLMEGETEYEWVREFKYRLHKAQGENFLFVWKDDCITYTEINSKVLMQKVTTDTDQPRSTRLILRKLPELSASARVHLDTTRKIFALPEDQDD
jgi:hypothetical protein